MENLLFETVKKSQEILAEYIYPESDQSAEETCQKLLGVLDDKKVVGTMRKNGQSIFWPTSQNVERTTYYHHKDILEVEFLNGGVYQYQDVPSKIWNEVKKADSIGSFMHQNIKGSYRYVKK